MKATWVQINGEGMEIFKDPITDDGMKKSAKGLIKVVKEDGKLVLKDGVTWDETNEGELKVLFADGVFYQNPTLNEIREKLNDQVLGWV